VWKCYKCDCFREMNSSCKRHMMHIRTIWIACPYFDVLVIVGVSILEVVSSPQNIRTLCAQKQQYPSSRDKLEYLVLWKSWILQMRFFPHCDPCSSLHSVCFILGFEVVLCEVVNSKGKHLIWEEVFKILHIRIHKNLLLHFTWYIQDHI